MQKEIIQLRGKGAGPTSIILTGIHGNEKCGIKAFKKIIPNLEIEKGQVFFGYGNPQAIKKNVRFVDANLNRMFKNRSRLSANELRSYEYRRSKFLKKYLAKADALLDLHASLSLKTKPFVICEAKSKRVAKYLPVNFIVSGIEKIQSGGTDYFMNSHGKIGICLECGYLKNPKSTLVAEISIVNFLKARGHIKNNLKPRKQSLIRAYTLYKTKTNNFSLKKSFGDFEEIKNGQVIGIDGAKEVRALKKSIIIFARNRKIAGSEAFILGEKKHSPT